MLTSNETAPTRQILAHIQQGTIVPMTNIAIIEEYTDVLTRNKFSFDKEAVKNLLEMQEPQVQCLGWEDRLKKEMATHSSIQAWKIPQTEGPGRLQPIGSQRVGHNRATNTL